MITKKITGKTYKGSIVFQPKMAKQFGEIYEKLSVYELEEELKKAKRVKENQLERMKDINQLVLNNILKKHRLEENVIKLKNEVRILNQAHIQRLEIVNRKSSEIQSIKKLEVEKVEHKKLEEEYKNKHKNYLKSKDYKQLKKEFDSKERNLKLELSKCIAGYRRKARIKQYNELGKGKRLKNPFTDTADNLRQRLKELRDSFYKEVNKFEHEAKKQRVLVKEIDQKIELEKQKYLDKTNTDYKLQFDSHNQKISSMEKEILKINTNLQQIYQTNERLKLHGKQFENTNEIIKQLENIIKQKKI
ncbi:MAG: hypothetical protein V1824_04590 [archaeon]